MNIGQLRRRFDSYATINWGSTRLHNNLGFYMSIRMVSYGSTIGFTFICLFRHHVGRKSWSSWQETGCFASNRPITLTLVDYRAKHLCVLLISHAIDLLRFLHITIGLSNDPSTTRLITIFHKSCISRIISWFYNRGRKNNLFQVTWCLILTVNKTPLTSFLTICRFRNAICMGRLSWTFSRWYWRYERIATFTWVTLMVLVEGRRWSVVLLVVFFTVFQLVHPNIFIFYIIYFIKHN